MVNIFQNYQLSLINVTLLRRIQNNHACKTCCITLRIQNSGKCSFGFSLISPKRSPRTYSKMKYNRLFSRMTSFNFTTLGWCSFFSDLTSLKSVTSSQEWYLRFIDLIATFSPVSTLVARYTKPYVPSPIKLKILYRFKPRNEM